MAGKRYNFVPKAMWSSTAWPAFQGIDQDVTDLESAVATLQSGGAGSVITSGPYTLDPKRAPAGSTVLLPAGSTVLTHVGNRFTGQTAGATPTNQTEALSGTLVFNAPSTGTWAYANGGLFGTRLDLTADATATNTSIMSVANLPASQKELLVSAILTIPEPTADCNVVALYRTSGQEISILVKPGSAAGKTQFIVNDSKTAGSWNYISPDYPSGSTVRFTLGGQIGDGTTGAQRGAAWIVNSDGTETQIGTTYAVSAATTPAADVYNGLQVGKLSGQASLEGKTIQIHAIRVAYGSGAYAAGPLKDERLYPAAV